MANQDKDQGRNRDNDTSNQKGNRDSDLTDSKRDQERLKADETTIDLPDVRDIPGQEHIHVAPLGELADTTISSDDEEGVGLFDEGEEEDDIVSMGTESDISADDRKALEGSENSTGNREEVRLERASLDDEDFEGDPLNEKSFANAKSGSDLDVPGASLDDANEAIGEEDEENNQYSLGGDSVDEEEDTKD